MLGKKTGDPLPPIFLREYSKWGAGQQNLGKPWHPHFLQKLSLRRKPRGRQQRATTTCCCSSEAQSPADVKPRRCPELTPLKRRLQITTCESWGGQRETELFEKFRSLSPFDLVGSLQWLGGTYAAHPQFFPREQSEREWITQTLLPLGILPPRRFITWTQSQWQRGQMNYKTKRCLLGVKPKPTSSGCISWTIKRISLSYPAL